MKTENYRLFDYCVSSLAFWSPSFNALTYVIFFRQEHHDFQSTKSQICKRWMHCFGFVGFSPVFPKMWFVFFWFLGEINITEVIKQIRVQLQTKATWPLWLTFLPIFLLFFGFCPSFTQFGQGMGIVSTRLGKASKILAITWNSARPPERSGNCIVQYTISVKIKPPIAAEDAYCYL